MLDKLKLIKAKLITGEGLKARAIRGSFFIVFGNGIDQVIRFIRNIILTRLLAPEVFGVMAILLAINGLVETFTDIGIKYAVIQNPLSEEEKYLNVAWWVSVIRSVILFIIGYLLAPFIAAFYENLSLVPLIRISFLCVILNGGLSIRYYVALKKFDMKRWVYITHGGGFVGVSVTVILAFIVNNVWALVIGLVVEALARCVLSYIITPFKPQWKYDAQSFKELMTFSKGVFGLGLFFFIFTQADIFFVGKLCTPFDLGLYTMASSLALVPVQFTSQIIDKIGMSAFAEMQHDNDRINKTFLDITSILAMLGIPTLVFIALNGETILTFVYGPAYGKAALSFVFITASLLLRTMSVPMAQIFFAKGNPGLHRYFTILRAVIILMLLYPAIKNFGITGAAVASLAAMFVGYIIQLLKLKYFTYFNVGNLLNVFVMPILLAIPVYALLKTIDWIFDSGRIINIIAGASVCFILYGYMGLRRYKSLKI